jgi:hypothetical protein
MEFNFNDVGSEQLSKANILRSISPYDIFNHYIGHFEIGKLMSSPIRIDNNPSFGIYVSKNNGELLFNDYADGGGDCIHFVMAKYRVNFLTALAIINRDFNLGLATGKINIDNIQVVAKPVISNYKPKPRSKIKISVKVRNWLDRDKEYWYDKYKINLETLIKFDVFPLTAFWMDSQRFYANKLCYGYYFQEWVFKIYQPTLTIKSGKWLSNIDDSIPWQGYKQLPEKGDILFITSSMKDVMVLYELGYSAIAPHTEKQTLSVELYNELHTRFKHVIVYYDNDEAGVLHSTKICNKYDIDYINNPKGYPKDPSDFVDEYGQTELVDVIIHLLGKKEII